ncbi:hypothetical protein [uncultured Paracoccus sp.]|uniref:hypothetical protein n=1 Tax=uncultured Paracoccus sp. TaxID=189685 RepID=UPI00261CE9B0|nr:hypothetical protein [uncultured Paracoccus sp.]
MYVTFSGQSNGPWKQQPLDKSTTTTVAPYKEITVVVAEEAATHTAYFHGLHGYPPRLN